MNNEAYTNVAIKLLLGVWAPQAAKLLNLSIPERWSEIAANIQLPYNEDLALMEEFDGMPDDLLVKQADVVLTNYPLEYRVNEREARNNLQYVRSPCSGPAYL